MSTEEEYVNDLQTVVDSYMQKVIERGLPEPDKGQERVIFGNIQQIYEWHREWVVVIVDVVEELVSTWPFHTFGMFKRTNTGTFFLNEKYKI